MTALARCAAAAPRTAGIAMDVADGRCVIPVRLDGRLARMILDTGAERSLITRAAAPRLGLTFDRWVETTMRDAGGRLETHPNADIAAATIGGIALYQRPPSRALSFAVASANLGGADGLLGGDLLRPFTLGLDMRRATLTLATADGGPAIDGCIRLRPLWPDLLLAPVVLNGCGLLALVDTGSTGSIINARGLSRLGLTPARLARDVSVSMLGVGGRYPARLHRFTELRIGSLTIPKPALAASTVPEAGFDMILGLDILGRRKLSLSYTELTMAFPGA
jgi:predicted aspartyl protease